MDWTWLDTWIVIVGALGAASCALVGNFLVLRRMSMMGDAISHAVLPGLAAAFLITGSRSSVVMFVGAAVVGVLTAVFTEWIRRLGRVEQSASMGVVFTSLFALGLVLIVRAADSVDLDPGCVLYGAIELTTGHTLDIAGFEVPRAVVQLGAVLLLDLAFVAAFYKELQITSFDPELATTLGIRADVLHYGLMTMVAITAVACFESVGSILVIAMLIVPAAAAHLLTNRLSAMIAVSLLLAAASAILGHASAITVPRWFGHGSTSTAGMMGVAAGGLFGLAFLFAPEQGVLSRRMRRARLARRVTEEDVRGLLFRLEELRRVEETGRSAGPAGAGPATREHPLLASEKPVAGLLRDALGLSGRRVRKSLARLERRGRIRIEGSRPGLTDRGREIGRELIRSHRLWESWLHKHLGVPVENLHRGAERLEHVTDPGMRDRLSEQADRPAIDPQGKPIP